MATWTLRDGVHPRRHKQTRKPHHEPNHPAAREGRKRRPAAGRSDEVRADPPAIQKLGLKERNPSLNRSRPRSALPPYSLRPAVSAFRELLGSPGLELEPDDGLVADDPCVVSGINGVGLTWADLLLGAVVVDDAHRARLQQADMAHLAPFASDDRLDALRPFPSGLQSNPRRTRSAQPNELIFVLSGVRVSSGDPKSPTSTPAMRRLLVYARGFTPSSLPRFPTRDNRPRLLLE